MTEHSNLIGGSTADRRINCPGSYALEETATAGKPEISGDFADQGSVLHNAMENILLMQDIGDHAAVARYVPTLIGQSFGYPERFGITNELIVTKIAPALNAFDLICKEYELTDWFVEQQLSLNELIPGAFGTVDVLARDKANRLHVIDWKFGDGEAVEVKGNYQLGFYAGCALYDTDPEVVKFCDGIVGIVVHIVQPRIGDNVVWHKWETTIDWVEDLIDLAIRAVEQIHAGTAQVSPGKHCRWCKALPMCPAHTNLAQQALNVTPKGVTAVELSKLLALARQLQPWINAVFKTGQEQAELGVTIPGNKLVQKRPMRVWIDEAEVEATMKRLRLKANEMYTRKILSPAQSEKAFPAQYKKHLGALCESRSSGLTLVEDTDKRPGVSDQFALLTEALDN